MSNDAKNSVAMAFVGAAGVCAGIPKVILPVLVSCAALVVIGGARAWITWGKKSTPQ